MACHSCSRPLPDGAKFCPFCGHAVVATSAEERRLVTVLFADIVGYTGLVEYLDPERVKRVIDGAFARLIADIVEHGGTVDKLLGDGILALFGAPIAHEDDADRAIRAAIKMHRSLAAFVEEHPELERRVELRIGVNTGEVLFGRVGGTDDYTAMGDVVNVASRLQTLAPPGATYMGDSTATLASAEISRVQIDNLDVRGREQTELVWQVTGRQRRLQNAGVARDVPFVGRRDQRDVLSSVISLVNSGRGALVAVTGEPGAGKTRLVTEALDAFDAPDHVIFAGACAPYGETTVWAPIARALFGRIEPDAAIAPDLLRELATARVAGLYGFDHGDPLLSWFVEGALHLAGFASALDEVPPAQARETLFRMTIESLRRRSAHGPVALWIDDLQWADNLLIDLLDRIARSLADRPVLIITAQRDDAEIAWPPSSDHPVIVRLPLSPLSRHESDRLVAAVIGHAHPEAIAAQLYERSGGNPLFLTELAELTAANPESTELPRSLRVLIAAQLDRLSPTARAVVDNAAVLGSDDEIESLQVFAQAMRQPFDMADIAALEAEGLLHVNDGRWRFRSDVVREVAYETLTKLARAERHAGVAASMAGSPGAPLERVAHHAATSAELIAEIGPASGVDPTIADQAVGYLAQAAQRSLDMGAFGQAVRQVSRAIALGTPDESMQRSLLLLRSTASTERRQVESARADAMTVLDLAVEAGDEQDEGVARRLLGINAQNGGSIDEARRELDASIEIFRRRGDQAELARSLADRGFVEVFGGSLKKADVLLTESEELAERLGDRRAAAWAREHQAWVAFLSGDVALATARLDTVSEQFEDLDDRAGRLWVQALRSYLFFYDRRFAEAEAMASQVRREAIELGQLWAPAMMDSLLASMRLWSGRFDEAEDLSRRALSSFRELGDRFGVVQALAPRMRALVALGRAEEAERGIEEALSLSESFGDLAFPAMAAAGTAVHLGLGPRAVVIGELAVERVTAMGANASESRTTMALALCQVGQPEEALALMLEVDRDSPYSRAVRALATAMLGVSDSAIANAAAVWDDEGSTYLDRVIADVADGAAELIAGRVDVATDRLNRATVTANQAGDVVAQALADTAKAQLLSGEPGRGYELKPGWRRVLNELTTRVASS